MTTKHRIFETTITYVECYRCGIPIAMTPQQERLFRTYSKETFYCVLGHGQVFREGEVDQLKKQLRDAQDRTTQAQTQRDNYIALLDLEEKKRRKLEKRIQNGVCPHCHRTFANLRRHMAGRHPGRSP